HNPIRAPRHHMSLALRDYPQATRTGIIFNRTPRRHLAHMPSTVKGFFVKIIRIKRGTVKVRGRPRAGLSAAFRMLFSSAVFLPDHATIVTYSPIAVCLPQGAQYRLYLSPICDLSSPNVLSPMPAVSMRICLRLSGSL